MQLKSPIEHLSVGQMAGLEGAGVGQIKSGGGGGAKSTIRLKSSHEIYGQLIALSLGYIDIYLNSILAL